MLYKFYLISISIILTGLLISSGTVKESEVSFIDIDSNTRIIDNSGYCGLDDLDIYATTTFFEKEDAVFLNTRYIEYKIKDDYNLIDRLSYKPDVDYFYNNIDYINNRFLPSSIFFKANSFDVKFIKSTQAPSYRDILRSSILDKYFTIVIIPDEIVFTEEIENGIKKYNIDGSSLSIQSTIVFVRKSKINSFIMIHELGHALGLHHLFNKPDTSTNGYSNRTGDMVCDTPKVRPPSSNKETACDLIEYDSCTETEKDIVDSNYMNYAYKDNTLDSFTITQIERMRWTINSNSDIRATIY